MYVPVCRLFRWKQKQVAENPDVNEMKTDDGLKTLQVGDVNVTWIQDNAEDKLMPVSLFLTLRRN